MPTRAPIAKAPGCEHSDRDRLRRRRREGLGRLYDSVQWRKRTQPFVLARDPICKIGTICGGHAPSTDADHIVPAAEYVKQHGGDQRYFFDLNNLQGACQADHTAKTRRGG
jgi:hypothetical protein